MQCTGEAGVMQCAGDGSRPADTVPAIAAPCCPPCLALLSLPLPPVPAPPLLLPALRVETTTVTTMAHMQSQTNGGDEGQYCNHL